MLVLKRVNEWIAKFINERMRESEKGMRAVDGLKGSILNEEEMGRVEIMGWLTCLGASRVAFALAGHWAFHPGPEASPVGEFAYLLVLSLINNNRLLALSAELLHMHYCAA